MARNRVIYQSEALYAVKTGAADAEQLIRVQDVSHTVDIARQDVNEFGKLAAITRSVVEPPTVGTDFTYYLGTGGNEVLLGLTVGDGTVGAVSGLITSDGDLNQRNLYVRTVPEGEDVASNDGSTADSAIGIGNAFITDWTLNAAVGDIPSVSVSTEGNNMNVTVGDSTAGVFTANNPGLMSDGSAISQATQTLPTGTTGTQSFGALRPGDVTLELGLDESMGGADLSVLHVQNCSVNIPLSRTSLNKLGDRYSYFKAPDVPVTATMSVSAIMSTAVAGNLSGMLCTTSSKDLSLTFAEECSATQAFKVDFKGATLDSQNFSSSIGDNQTVDLTWSTQIGGPTDTGNGVFLQGPA